GWREYPLSEKIVDSLSTDLLEKVQETLTIGDGSRTGESRIYQPDRSASDFGLQKIKKLQRPLVAGIFDIQSRFVCADERRDVTPIVESDIGGGGLFLWGLALDQTRR